MTRKQLVERCLQKGQTLTFENAEYRRHVDTLFRWLLASDDAEHDCTTQALGLHERTCAVVRTRQAGIVAGIDEVLFLLQQYPSIIVESRCADGSAVNANDDILTMSLNMNDLLALERTILNVIGRLSGIATQTQHLVTMAQQLNSDLCVAATRKAPWMLLDKRGVFLGGGLTHRLSLGDAVLIKDNHLAAFQHQSGYASIEEAIQNAVKKLVKVPMDYFEIEVESIPQARSTLQTYENAIQGAERFPVMVVLLDNFSPAQAQDFIQEVRGSGIYEHILFEGSGEINENTIPTWAMTGIDYVSLGAITHSVKAFNISMATC